jgi:hypothetical protein
MLLIRIQRIRMFLGLLGPDLLVRGTDTDPSIIKQKQKEKPCFLLLCVNVPLKTNKQKK